MAPLLLALLLQLPGGTRAVDEIAEVTAPAEALTAGETHSVVWEYTTEDEVASQRTTGDLHPFEIELRSCGPDAEACGASATCGSPFRQLCSGGGGDAQSSSSSICMDSDGSYDVVIPEDAPAGSYVFSVTYLGVEGWSSASSFGGGDGAGATGCSAAFTVVEPSLPALTATAPGELQPGDAFTARWEYDAGADAENGGNFEVNLYSCTDGSCANDRWVLILFLLTLLRDVWCVVAPLCRTNTCV